MIKMIKFDLGSNIGHYEFPVGSKILFECSLPIFVRCVKYWQKNHINIKNELKEDQGLVVHKIINIETNNKPSNEVNDTCIRIVFDYNESIDDKSIIVCLNDRMNNFDYKITLNGIFNKQNELIKKYAFLSEANHFYCNETGLAADTTFFGLDTLVAPNTTLIFNHEKIENPVIQDYYINEWRKRHRQSHVCYIGQEDKYNFPNVQDYPLYIKNPRFFDGIFDALNLENLIDEIPLLRHQWSGILLSGDGKDLQVDKFICFLKEKTALTQEKLEYIQKAIESIAIYLIASDTCYINIESFKQLNKLAIQMLYHTFAEIKRIFFLEINDISLDETLCQKIDELNRTSIGVSIVISNFSKKRITLNKTNNNESIFIKSDRKSAYCYDLVSSDYGIFCFQKMHSIGRVNYLNLFSYSLHNKNSYHCKMMELIELIKNEDLDGLLLHSNLSLVSDGASNTNILSLLVIHSKSFAFLSNAWEKICVKHPDLFNINRNYLNILSCRNENFFSSDLILFFEWFLSRYHKPTISYETSIYSTFAWLRSQRRMSEEQSSIIKNLIFKYFPLKILGNNTVTDFALDNQLWTAYYPFMTQFIKDNYDILSSDDLNYICLKLFNSKGKKIKKYYINNIHINPIRQIVQLNFISNFFENYDVKMAALNKVNSLHDSDNILVLQLLKISNYFKKNKKTTLFLTKRNEGKDFFIKNISELDRKKILLNNLEELEYLRDTVDQFYEYYELTGKIFATTNVRSIRDLHDQLSKAIHKAARGNKIFSNEDINHIDNYCFNFGAIKYKIKIPKDSDAVSELGDTMSICIGASSYINTVVNKTHFIIMLEKEDKLYAAIHCKYSTGTIVQIKKHHNEIVEEAEEEMIQSAIYSAISVK